MPEQRLADFQRYPLVYFAGVLALTESGSFHPINTYTSQFAGLLWTTRDLFLHLCLPAR